MCYSYFDLIPINLVNISLFILLTYKLIELDAISYALSKYNKCFSC